MPLYGRSRLSIADIESDLHDLIANHPRAHHNDDGEPVVPAEALVDILTSYRSSHDNVELLSKEEEEMFLKFIRESPGLEATTKVLVEFIAFRTASGDKPPESALSSDEGSESDFPHRGRRSRDAVYNATSRSSSSDSTGTSSHRPSSRPPSLGPPVPSKSPNLRDSVFDASKRQRSTPLVNRAPSSWAKRPLPASRRKSDAGRGASDSESGPTTPTWDRRRSSQSRTSNPASPDISHTPLSSPPLGSRPHSRSQSYPQNIAALYASDRFDDSDDLTISQPVSAENSLDEMSFLSSIGSFVMPKRDDGSDSDDEVQNILVYDRSIAPSNASMDSQERVDVLNKTIDELRKKLSDTEKGLNRKVNDLELELEEAQEKLEELKAELVAGRKEEKELKSKEKQNQSQISALEAEISKLQKGLDNSRSSYQSLQKQYQEQCTESERYRLSLRRRDTEVKEFTDAAALHAVETDKWNKEQQILEDRINQLTVDLELAQQAYSTLDDQKAENLLLKETIDRLRFEMDEMRSNAANALEQSKDGVAGNAASVGRTLGAEMVRAGVDPHAAPPQEVDSEDETVIDEIINQESDDDEFIQTVITKTRKRKIHGRMPIPTLTVEREYADAEVQHGMSTLDVEIQTLPEPKPVMASFSIQTEETPVTSTLIQTDPEPSPPQKILVEMQIQTDEIDVDETASTGQHEGEESLASSSSTLIPPTPKPSAEPLHPHDMPPTYDRSELDFRVAEAIKDLHPGSTRPNEALRRLGVSDDALEEWRALKAELGVECAVIDKVLQDAPKSGGPRPSTSSAASSSTSSDSSSSSRKGRFYNIYNTYVYGGESGGPGALTNMILCAGASAVAFVLMAHLVNPQYHIPGGPTYYDRAAWTSFNTMQASGEGFGVDGANAFWDLVGRLSGNAARIVQGWPT